MKVQLLTFPGCPNATAAREVVQRVLSSCGIRASLVEVNTTAPETPERLRGWGSPTILIDGVDIEGQDTPAHASCRLYRDSAGRLRGVPPRTSPTVVGTSPIECSPPSSEMAGALQNFPLLQ